MKLAKRITTFVLALGLTLSMTSCSSTTWAVKSGDDTIPTGYIFLICFIPSIISITIIIIWATMSPISLTKSRTIPLWNSISWTPHETPPRNPSPSPSGCRELGLGNSPRRSLTAPIRPQKIPMSQRRLSHSNRLNQGRYYRLLQRQCCFPHPL